ncbi:hypothetical protein LINPERHAP2_LOCUS9512 [Linum perenne]
MGRGLPLQKGPTFISSHDQRCYQSSSAESSESSVDVFFRQRFPVTGTGAVRRLATDIDLFQSVCFGVQLYVNGINL